jgi:hypothetical protein
MIRKTKRTTILAGIGVAFGLWTGVLSADAAWPSGEWRTLPGPSCTPFTVLVDSSDSYCPFVSDYISDADSFYAGNNGLVYVDFHVFSTRGSGNGTQAEACRQSYTGSAVACGADSSESDGTVGIKHLAIAGFDTIAGTANTSDYFYVHILTTEDVDQVYGVAYGD